ncbi:leukocyte immunoglobulin-like receptor subfamily A member 3 [Podarcis raffonei]|uniref:leukocyte immunoglobulin-like receptor subfamily A member 3 n=1 Tax=Podarcis raffonei TaxID=65483 RepID=UPI002329452F|nr:leukocyte immunoglobulin-like receptor subfamily A member 3 [Podarcis raffonei]
MIITTRTDAGIYKCLYNFAGIRQVTDPFELLIRDPSFPKPVLSLEPMDEITIGQRVTMRCGTQGEVKRFYLQKDNFQDWSIHSDMNMFTISDVSNKDAGRYSCSYTSVRQPYLLSEPSNSVELLLTDPQLLRPTISISPTRPLKVGENITITCAFPETPALVYLHKAGESTKTVQDSNARVTKFYLRKITLEGKGNYCCSWAQSRSPFLVSKCSNWVELLVSDPYFPRPIISLGPTELVAFGGNVTFQCQSKKFSTRFYSQKSGEEMLQPCLGTDETTAQCFVSNVDQAHTGEYSCRYSESKPFIISKTSELVRLLMTDQNIARPNISLIPGYIAQLGSKVTIQCSAQGQSKRFYLHKAEDKKNLQIAVTNEDRKNFSINKMDWEHGGSFYCSYTEPSQFFTSSETSDRVELFVLGEDTN